MHGPPGWLSAVVAVLALVACGSATIPSPRPSRAPAPTQAEQARAWGVAIKPSLDGISASLEAQTKACAVPVDLTRCRAAAGDVYLAAQRAEVVLDAAAPPACLRDVAQQWRAAIGLLDSGEAATAAATTPLAAVDASSTVHESIGRMQAAGDLAGRAAC